MRFQFFSGLCFPLILGSLISVCAADDAGNRSAVQEVQSGKRTTANAAWWGFDPQDATATLQAA